MDLTAIDDLAAAVERSALPPPRRRRHIRQQAGVSLREAAAALGVAPMTLVRWEEGATPRRERAQAYRALLDRLDEVAR